MFEKKNIDLIYRLICLIVFLVVILFDRSMITLCILALFFVLVTKNDNSFSFLFLYLLTFMMFCISYMSGDYSLLKLAIIVDYFYYFLNIPGVKMIVNKLINKLMNSNLKIEKNEEQDESDNDYLRFKKNLKLDKMIIKRVDFGTTLYVTIHFVVLFISIVVG